MIHLYRHAHAGRRKHWDGPDRERPLSDRGREQADLITERLVTLGVTRLLTSPYVRCVESVDPLAAATGLPVEIESALEEYSDPEEAIRLIAEIGEGAVLCSHGDIVSAVIGHLSAEGADLDAGLIWEKGSVWELERSESGRVISGRYEPPPVTGL